MIQRVQSVYLALALVVTGLMFFFPLGTFLGGVEQFRLYLGGLYNAEGVRVENTSLMSGFALTAMLQSTVAIFFYKKRPVQINLCNLAMSFLAGLQFLVCFYLWSTFKDMTGFTPNAFSFSVAAVLPVIAFILVWLAMRGVKRDDAMVRSLERVR